MLCNKFLIVGVMVMVLWLNHNHQRSKNVTIDVAKGTQSFLNAINKALNIHVYGSYVLSKPSKALVKSCLTSSTSIIKELIPAKLNISRMAIWRFPLI